MLTRKTMPTDPMGLLPNAARLRRERTNAAAPTIALTVVGGAVAAFLSNEITALPVIQQKLIIQQMATALMAAADKIA